MKLDEYIYEQANKILLELKTKGALGGGHNGPYYDNETSIRVSSHWIIIFSYLYNKSKNEKYYIAIKKIAEHLKSEHEKGINNAFLCRDKKGKDKINGTIGQAWAIEGLIEAAKILKDESYYEIARKVYFQQEFDENVGVWNRVEVDNNKLGFDITYNHQLWFAAAGTQIIKYKFDPKIDEQINIFLNKSDKLFLIHRNGLIRHFANIKKPFIKGIYNLKRDIVESIKQIFKFPSLEYKELGYHCFNLYGFALIYEVYSSHKFFKSKKFNKALKFALDEDFINKLEKNEYQLDSTNLAKKYKCDCNLYSFGYNSPVFEIPYIIKIFNGAVDRQMIEKLWQKQIEYTYDSINRSFSRNTEDSLTLNSRLYELVRAL